MLESSPVLCDCPVVDHFWVVHVDKVFCFRLDVSIHVDAVFLCVHETGYVCACVHFILIWVVIFQWVPLHIC